MGAYDALRLPVGGAAQVIAAIALTTTPWLPLFRLPGGPDQGLSLPDQGHDDTHKTHDTHSLGPCTP